MSSLSKNKMPFIVIFIRSYTLNTQRIGNQLFEFFRHFNCFHSAISRHPRIVLLQYVYLKSRDNIQPLDYKRQHSISFDILKQPDIMPLVFS